ncbi:MAG: tetratricopeptide repeat protein [Candidatus Cloacimonetes bacterium]|nr:tetratricopeptide repeat protein [Candidatus Cloacimonadota bacterium]
MKKGIIGILIMLIVAGLWGEAHDNSEYAEFQKYQTEPTLENLVSALQYYSALDNETGKLMITYLHFMALESSLEGLAAEGDSLSMQTRFNYANLLLDLGRYEEAIPLYDKLNVESPQWGCPWRHKGEAYWKQGKIMEAEASLRQSIAVRENHYDAYVMLAKVLRDAGRYEEALETLEKGLPYGAENPEYSEDSEFESDVKLLHEELRNKVNGE